MQEHGRADANGRTGHGDDHGLVAVQQRGHEAIGRVLHRVAYGSALSHAAAHEVFQIIAAGEDAGLPRDQHGAHRGFLAGSHQGLGHGLVHIDSQRILLRGAGNFYRENAVECGGFDGHSGLLGL